jgi:dihydroorotate dehydrogenase
MPLATISLTPLSTVAVEIGSPHRRPALGSGQNIEARYGDIVKAVCSSVALPISVEMTPYLSAIGHSAEILVQHCAAGLVLSTKRSRRVRLPLLWIAILAGRTKASLAASTGLSSVDDVVKCLLAGADVAMTTSALLRKGKAGGTGGLKVSWLGKSFSRSRINARAAVTTSARCGSGISSTE